MSLAPSDDKQITYFAETDARNKRVKFGIKAEDRTRHVYVIGKTGMGKSTLLENMAAQDIQNGEGICFIDPHGKTADLLLEYVPQERIRDVIYIAPFDTEYPISFNVLESVDPTKRHLVVSGLMSTFKKIWEDAWSARMEYILTNTLLALLEAPNTTLLGVNRMLSDKAYRNEIISHVTDPSVRSFWVKEFANYTERMAAEAVPAIQNKVGQFTANPLIRNMIGQPQSSFSFREAMDSRKIVIINLSKGRIGDENMKLLGGLLVTKIYLAAMSRADVSDRVIKMLPNFYLFVDEFQNFANASFADILSEARKYKLNLTIAHQYIEQMDETVRSAVFGNVGTMITFRVGATDAEVLEKEFSPQFVIEDFVNLGKYQLYLKLMIDGLSSAPFSAVTLPPIPHPDVAHVEKIIAASREQFARPRAEVEAEVVKFHESTPPVKKLEALSERENGGNPKSKTLNPKQTQNSNAPRLGGTDETRNSKSDSSAVARPKGDAKAETQKPIATTQSPFAAVPKAVVAPGPSASPSSSADSTISRLEPPPKQVSVPRGDRPDRKKPPLEGGHGSLKDALASAMSREQVEPPKSAPPVPPPKQATGQPARPAPMPLSSLASKPKLPQQQPKRDPKVPTRENVDGLKSALMAAMGKKDDFKLKIEDSKSTGQSSHKESALVSIAPDSMKALKEIPKAPPQEPKAPPQTAAPVVPQDHSTNGPKEVPEDVLKDVLKVE